MATGIEADQSLDGRVVIITGGYRGNGRAVASCLRSLGAKLVVNYASSSAHADAVAADLNSSGSDPDISDPDQVKHLFDEAESAFGSAAHVFVNCAGAMDPKYPSVADTAGGGLGLHLQGQRAARVPRLPGGCEPAEARRRGEDRDGDDLGRREPVPRVLSLDGVEGSGEDDDENHDEGAEGDGDHGQLRRAGPVGTELFFAGKTEETVKRTVVGFLAIHAGEWVNGEVIRVNGGIVI
ncbi:hypothetical protein BT93_A1797 [Corymbia citriodora subsp. variegata]|nr:hypothetical protein BT93_A1797 [Corymbia citriodora subsp. variegata]